MATTAALAAATLLLPTLATAATVAFTIAVGHNPTIVRQAVPKEL